MTKLFDVPVSTRVTKFVRIESEDAWSAWKKVEKQLEAGELELVNDEVDEWYMDEEVDVREVEDEEII